MPKENDLTQEPFVPYKLEEEKEKDGESFTVWISSEERVWLNDMKRILHQPKDSTALKQLAKIGANLIGEPSTAFLIDTVFKNKTKNQRLGINIVE